MNKNNIWQIKYIEQVHLVSPMFQFSGEYFNNDY